MEAKKQSWKEQRDEICTLIQAISNHHGGDDIEWLRSYAKDVIQAHRDDLTIPLVCFRDLHSQIAYTPRMEVIREVQI